MSARRRNSNRTLLIVILLCVILPAVLLVIVAVSEKSYYHENQFEYKITNVTMDVTLAENGTLSVHEERTYDFKGDFNGVYWEIGTGSRDDVGDAVTVPEVDVTAVSYLLSDGTPVQCSLTTEDDAFLGDDGVYTVENDTSNTKVKLYHPASNETVTYAIDYTYTGAVYRWQDVGDIYWRFVSDGWDVDSNDVTCTLHLPVPAGESAKAGDNVKAWGHGPLSGNVDINEDGTITFTVPTVEKGDFAEMRVAFPEAWVSQMEQQQTTHLSLIEQEESQWAQEADATRAGLSVLRNGLVVAILYVVVLTVLSFILIVKETRAYNKRIDSGYADKYFRDIPTNDPPALLAILLDSDADDSPLVSATLLGLIDKGICTLQKVPLSPEEQAKSKTLIGRLRHKKDYDWLLTQVAPSTDVVERATLKLVFGADEDAGRQAVQPFTTRGILLSQIGMGVTSNAPRHQWEGSVWGSYHQRFLASGRAPEAEALRRWRNLYWIFAVVLFVGMGIFLYNTVLTGGDDALNYLLALVLIGFFGTLLLASRAGSLNKRANRMENLSPEAIEVRGRVKALKRWLTDFTRLEEALPEDVVLWNRLLVMATALDISEEVIERLSTCLPEVVSDPDFETSRVWFYGDSALNDVAGGVAAASVMGIFADTFSDVFYQTESSSGGSSSSDGGGGGFSSGGGGGAGGGGGGGAF